MSKAELGQKILARIDSIITVSRGFHSEKGALGKYTTAPLVEIHYRPNRAIAHFKDGLGNLVGREVASSGAELVKQHGIIFGKPKKLT